MPRYRRHKGLKTVSVILGYLPHFHPELLNDIPALLDDDFSSLATLHANGLNLTFVGECIKRHGIKSRLTQRREAIMGALGSEFTESHAIEVLTPSKETIMGVLGCRFKKTRSSFINDELTLNVLHSTGIHLCYLAEMLPPIDWRPVEELFGTKLQYDETKPPQAPPARPASSTYCKVEFLQDAEALRSLDALRRAANEERCWHHKHDVGGFPLVVLGEESDEFRIVALCADSTRQSRVVVGAFEHCSKEHFRDFEEAMRPNSDWERKLRATARVAKKSIFRHYMRLSQLVDPAAQELPQAQGVTQGGSTTHVL